MRFKFPRGGPRGYNAQGRRLRALFPRWTTQGHLNRIGHDHYDNDNDNEISLFRHK